MLFSRHLETLRTAATWLAVSLLAFTVAYAVGGGSADQPAEAVEVPAPAAETAVVLETTSDAEPVPQLRSAPPLARLLPPPRKRSAPARTPAPAPAPAPTAAPEPPSPPVSSPPSPPPPVPQPTAQPTPPPETFDSVGDEFDSPG